MIACAAAAGQIRYEVNGLLAVSRFCLHADRRLCLQASEEALAKSHALEDDVFKALVQGSSASINLYLKGWREDDAALCQKAMNLTADAQDHGTLIRRLGIEGILECSRSRYQECRVSATHGKRLAQEAGDIYVFVLFNVMESTALLHLGEWRQLQRETAAALALAEKNANQPASALCRLTLAWLHVEAMDFHGARELCEEVDDAMLDENPFAYFFHRAVLAKAFVGLNDPQSALKQFDDVQRTGRCRWHRSGFYDLHAALSLLLPNTASWWVTSPRLGHGRCNFANTRHRRPIGIIWRWRMALLARIALAAGDFEEARAQLDRALATLDDADLPLAAWRVFLTAAEMCERFGEASKASEYRHRFENVMRTLAQNFGPEDRLRASLLTALETKKSVVNHQSAAS